MAKTKNSRCPLQVECERKCTFEGHELDCSYYINNAIGEGRTIEDQERIRREQERAAYEAQYEAELADVDGDNILSSGEEGLALLAYLPIDRLHPHPKNPRKALGDISELTESIKANGILQNLTVIPMSEVADCPQTQSAEEQYVVLIGHRRLAAAKEAGLTELPCVVVDMDERQQVQTMLIENMQRSDLTIYEQAQGFQMMLDLGSTVEEIAQGSGFSTTTVRRRVKMMELDQDVLKTVSERQISISDFDRLSQVEEITIRNTCLAKIGTHEFDVAVTGAIRRQNIKAKLSGVKKRLKELDAKEIKADERWSNKYQRCGHTIDILETDPEHITIPKGVKGTALYYLSEYGSLDFYSKIQKAAPEKKSPEEKARLKAIADAWQEADELSSIAYTLRSDFVSKLRLGKNNLQAMLDGAVVASIFRTLGYDGADRKIKAKVLGTGTYLTREKMGDAVKAAAQDPAGTYPLLIYAEFQDSKELNYLSGHRGVFPTHYDDARLDALYDWLCALGYEMSDDEKALRYGSHRIFSLGGDGNDA